MSCYTEPEAAGCLLEAEACVTVIKELDRLIAKFQRKSDRERDVRKKDLEAALGYGSEDEIRDAYGWGSISEKQFEHYIDLLRAGEDALEHHPPTRTERALSILCHIRKALDRDRQEWEISAMTPEQWAKEYRRRMDANHAWKEKLRQLKDSLTAGAEQK